MGRKKSKFIRIKSHTRRVDVQDAWGRFSHSKNIKVKGYRRKR